MASNETKIPQSSTEKEIVPQNEKEVAAPETTEIAPVSDHNVNFDSTDIEKLKGLINDEAGKIAIEAIVAGNIDPEKAKKVLRKIDMYILPILCITYGIKGLEDQTKE
jgi:hypothetical protein